MVGMVVRHSKAFAYLQGIEERLILGHTPQRLHPTLKSWSEAYERGASMADQVMGVFHR